MRATRAYVAGFGTAGSLVAGAAIMFVLASAVVSFRGWPQIALQSPPATLQALHQPHAQSTPTSRRLEAAATTVTSAGRAQRGSGSHQGASASHPSGRVTPGNPTQPAGTVPVQSLGGGAPGSSASTATTSKPTSQPGTIVQGTANQLGNTVSSVGQTLGSTVSHLVGAVANVLSSTPLGGTVKNVGNALGGALSGTGSALGGLLTHH